MKVTAKGLISTSLLVVAATAGLSVGPAEATGQNSCVNLVDACMGEQNSTNPTRYYGTSGNKTNLDGYTYSNGTSINDRVNSVRVRTETATYTGVCWYRDANYVVARTYRAETAGWYDNSAIDISSMKWVTSSCL